MRRIDIETRPKATAKLQTQQSGTAAVRARYVPGCEIVGIGRGTGYRWRAEDGGLPPARLGETAWPGRRSGPGALTAPGAFASAGSLTTPLVTSRRSRSRR